MVTGLVVLVLLPSAPMGLRANGLTALLGLAVFGFALSGYALVAGAECCECSEGDMAVTDDVGEGGMITLGLRGGGPSRAD